MLHLARNLKSNTLVAQNVIKQDNQVRPNPLPTTVNSIQLFCNCVLILRKYLSLSKYQGRVKQHLLAWHLSTTSCPFPEKAFFLLSLSNDVMWNKAAFCAFPAPACILLVFKALTLYCLFQTLTQSLKLADQNFEKLKAESDRLEQHAKKSVNWLLWLMLIIVCFIFISMILFIRIFPKLR